MSIYLIAVIVVNTAESRACGHPVTAHSLGEVYLGICRLGACLCVVSDRSLNGMSVGIEGVYRLDVLATVHNVVDKLNTAVFIVLDADAVLNEFIKQEQFKIICLVRVSEEAIGYAVFLEPFLIFLNVAAKFLFDQRLDAIVDVSSYLCGICLDAVRFAEREDDVIALYIVLDISESSSL